MESEGAWLQDHNRPSTILHRVIQRRILEHNSSREVDHQTINSSLKAMDDEVTTQLSATACTENMKSPNDQDLSRGPENKYDIWQQDVTKYLNMLQK